MAQHNFRFRGYCGLVSDIAKSTLLTRTGHFRSQQMYFEALKARGFEAYMLQANSVGGTKYHALGPIGIRIAGWCASGVKSDEIVHKVQQGLQ